MPPLLEHDYIGLSEASAGVRVQSWPAEQFSLKETELRLGPPGSLSPERNNNNRNSNSNSGATASAVTLDLLPKSSSVLVAGAKRGFADVAINGSAKWSLGSDSPPSTEVKDQDAQVTDEKKAAAPPPAKAQAVGWPPIRNYRKNTMASNQTKSKEDEEAKHEAGCLYVKVSMDGAPYLRKVDLKIYKNYKELSVALEKMFGSFTSSKEGSSESRKADQSAPSEYVLTYEDKDGDWMLVGDVPWEMFAGSCRRLRIMKGSDAIGLAPRATDKAKNQN